MRFMLLMLPQGYATAAPDALPTRQMVESMMTFNRELMDAGILLALDGLAPPSTGSRVHFSGGTVLTHDGPFAEAKEVIGGYWMIEVRSKAEAVLWARRCPANDGDVIEVRQVQELSDFPEDVREAAGTMVWGS